MPKSIIALMLRNRLILNNPAQTFEKKKYNKRIIKLPLHLLLSYPDLKKDDHSILPRMDAKVILYLLGERELVTKSLTDL